MDMPSSQLTRLSGRGFRAKSRFAAGKRSRGFRVGPLRYIVKLRTGSREPEVARADIRKIHPIKAAAARGTRSRKTGAQLDEGRRSGVACEANKRRSSERMACLVGFKAGDKKHKQTGFATPNS